MPGKADAFKGGVECPLGDRFVCESGHNFGGDNLSAGKVYNTDGTTVYGIPKEKDSKIRCFDIAINPTFLEVGATVGFYID